MICCKFRSENMNVYNKVKTNIKEMIDLKAFITLRNEVSLLKYCLITNGKLLQDFDVKDKYIFIDEKSTSEARVVNPDESNIVAINNSLKKLLKRNAMSD